MPLTSDIVKVFVSPQVKSYSATEERVFISDNTLESVSDARAVVEKLLLTRVKIKSAARNNFVFDFIKKIIDKDIVAWKIA